MFDESYYVTASLDLLHGVANNLEHPFFGKLWGALGIAIFGDNFFGWRIFYAVIGTLSVWLMYELARVFFTKEKALLAASMLAFENLFFVHTSLLLLDGPPVLFALAGYLAYFKRRYYVSALLFGLCILSKEDGLFFVLALVIYHLWAHGSSVIRRVEPLGLKKILVFALILTLVVSVPLWGYDAAYHPYSKTTILDETVVSIDPLTNFTVTSTTTKTLQSYPVTEPAQNFIFYFTYQTSLKGCGSTNPWNCYPWNWILPFNVAPLPYFVSDNTVTKTTTTCASPGVCAQSISATITHPVDWQGIGNLVVWYSIWLVVPLVAWRLLRRTAKEADGLVACLIAGTYAPWILVSVLTQRVEYAFYFINTDVGLALGIPLVVTFLARGRVGAERLLIVLWVGAAVVFFFHYFPVNPFAFTS